MVGELVIGVDGGGTKTVAAIAEKNSCNNGPSDLEILGRGTAGPANIRSVGEESAFKNIDHALDLAFKDARLERGPVASVCLGLAGADRENEKRVIREWADQSQLGMNIQVVNDALPVLFGGNPAGIGIALVCGTGSLAFGRDSTGATARCGGWGSLIGDEGSGYWIAVEGLRNAVRYADGRAKETTLLSKMLEQLNLADSSQLVPHIYGSPFSRRELARLAPVVFEAAVEGDQSATKIIENAASHLIELVATVATRLVFSDSLTVAMTGGVLIHGHLLLTIIEREIRQKLGDDTSIQLVPDPIVGALRVAANV